MKLTPSPPRIAGLIAALFLLDLASRGLAGEPLNLVTIGLAVMNGVLLGLVLAWLVPRLSLRRSHLLGLLWFALLIIEYASGMVEGYFYTTVFSSVWQLLAALPVVAGFALAQVGLASYLLLTQPGGPSFREALRKHLAFRSQWSWTWRIAAASALYLPIYYFFGALVGPYVLEYYTQAGIGLVLPPISVIIPLELARGLLYVAALFPILVVLRESRLISFLAMATLLYIPGALLPLLTQTSVPAAIIPFHSLELLADSLVYGLVLVWLLQVEPGALQTTEDRPLIAPRS